MSVASDIAATWLHPARSLAARAAAARREDRALATLLAACALIFVAQWPRLARVAHVDGQDLDALLMGALFGWLFVAPLLFYALALLVHWILRLLGGTQASYQVRAVLFWGLLAATPGFLLTGLVAGLIGPGPGLTLVGAATLGALLLFWGLGLRRLLTVAMLP